MVADTLLYKKKISMILRAVPLVCYRLSIEFPSGSFLDFDMKNSLRTTRYHDLNDPTIFFSATTDGSRIIFKQIITI